MSDAPSFCSATYLDKALVVGFRQKILLGRFSAISADTSTLYDTMFFDAQQMVRSVCFLQIPDGPLCIASVGDGKMLHLHNISSATENQSSTTTGAAAAVTSPCYSFGPHTKRITHVASCSEGIVVFADKFGEVYRMRLHWSPEHQVEPEGCATEPATFLLQHFSIFSCLFLSSPVLRPEVVASTEERSNTFCRRLFTCDKDCHVRVSRFPETYAIEQFLWGQQPNQSVVTTMTEIPWQSKASNSTSATSTAAGGVELPLSHLTTTPSHQQGSLPSRSYYVLGHHDGTVTFWVANNTLASAEKEDSLKLLSTVLPPSTADAEAAVRGGVVGLCYAVADRDQKGFPRHPEDSPRGVFVAHDRCAEVLFIPLMESSTVHGMHVLQARAIRVSLPHPAVALHRCTNNTAVAVTRMGTIHFLELMPAGEVAKGKDVEAQDWKVQQRNDFQMSEMAVRVRQLCCGVEEGEADVPESNPLGALDLWATWETEVVDPRKRKRQDNEQEDDSD